MDRLAEIVPEMPTPRAQSFWRRLAGWPARVVAARQAMRQLSGMSDRELADISLTRQDLSDATALSLDADPTRMFARRVAERRRVRLLAAPRDRRGLSGQAEAMAGEQQEPTGVA